MSARDSWEMVCPECKADDFEVEIKVFARLHEDGTEIDGGDHEWSDESQCYCIECGWMGAVSAAKAAYRAEQVE